MKITFFGQLGLDNSISGLGSELASRGHEVTVFETGSYATNKRNIGGINLVKKASFDPSKDGGMLYLLLCIASLIKQQPDVIQVSGVKAARVLRIFSWFLLNAEIVVNVGGEKLIGNRKLVIGSNIVTSNLGAHYRLLKSGVDAKYIPEGFTPEATSAPSFSLWDKSLRKGQYAVALTSKPASLRTVQSVYAKTKTKKKLVSPKELKVTTPRALRSLIAGAAFVAVDDSVETNIVLQAMADGVAIVATNSSKLRAILGSTAQFYPAQEQVGRGKTFDYAQGKYTPATRDGILLSAMKAVLTKKQAQQYWGQLAARRALSNFTWERILPEYLQAYSGAGKRVVFVDSIKVKAFTQPAVN